jgi:hypothetical protein
MPINEPLPLSEVVGPPLIETPNPNEAGERNPGDPSISLNADGTVAICGILIQTVPVNAEPSLQSDPAHVPSPYQPDVPEVQAEARRLREESIQAENRIRPDRLEPNREPEPQVA